MTTTVWLGTAGWSYFPDWVGPFYPPGTSPSDALSRYVEAFSSVEIDSTFYAAPAPAVVDRWASIMPSTFRVSLKAPKELVQDTGLRPPDIPFGHFTSMLADRLGPRLGCIVVQMPPSFARTPENELALRVFVTQWSAQVPLAVEFRHRSWRVAEVDDLLRAHSVATISQDLRDVPGLTPRAVSTSQERAYVRLIGQHDGIGKDRIVRAQDAGRSWWVDRLGEFAADGVKAVFVIVNNHWEGHAPATVRQLRDEIESRSNPLIDVVPFAGLPGGQASLF